MSKNNDFKTGDIVRLKSGGPDMTVSQRAINPDTIHCQWFSGKKLEAGIFKLESLTAVTTPGEE
jgi:uncharacterized protein YodC (DUF2158 family)